MQLLALLLAAVPPLSGPHAVVERDAGTMAPAEGTLSSSMVQCAAAAGQCLYLAHRVVEGNPILQAAAYRPDGGSVPGRYLEDDVALRPRFGLAAQPSGDYLASWVTTTAAQDELVTARLDAQGTLLEVPVVRMTARDPVRLRGPLLVREPGGRHLFVHSSYLNDGGTPVAVGFVNANGALLGGAPVGVSGPKTESVSACYYAGRFLVALEEGLPRVPRFLWADLDGGIEPLSPGATASSGLGIAAAANRRTAVVLWSSGTSLLGSWLADGGFTPAATLFATAGATIGGPVAAPLGDDFVVAWKEAALVRMLRLSPDGVASAPQLVGPASSSLNADSLSVSCLDDAGCLLGWSASNQRLLRSWTDGLVASAPLDAVETEGDLVNARVAQCGDRLLASWHSEHGKAGRVGLLSGSGSLMAPLAEQDLSYRYDGVAVAGASADVCLSAAHQTRSVALQNFFADGGSWSISPLLPGDAGHQDLAVQATGDGFRLAVARHWGLALLRVSPQGNVLENFLFPTGGGVDQPRIDFAPGAGKALVVWLSQGALRASLWSDAGVESWFPTLANRSGVMSSHSVTTDGVSFLISSVTGGAGRAIELTQVPPDGGFQTAGVSGLPAARVHDTQLYFHAGQYLLVYSDTTPGDAGVYLTTVSAADGGWVAEPPVRLVAQPFQAGPFRPTFSPAPGGGALLVYERMQYPLTLRRLEAWLVGALGDAGFADAGSSDGGGVVPPPPPRVTFARFSLSSSAPVPRGRATLWVQASSDAGLFSATLRLRAVGARFEADSSGELVTPPVDLVAQVPWTGEVALLLDGPGPVEVSGVWEQGSLAVSEEVQASLEVVEPRVGLGCGCGAVPAHLGLLALGLFVRRRLGSRRE